MEQDCLGVEKAEHRNQDWLGYRSYFFLSRRLKGAWHRSLWSPLFSMFWSHHFMECLLRVSHEENNKFFCQFGLVTVLFCPDIKSLVSSYSYQVTRCETVPCLYEAAEIARFWTAIMVELTVSQVSGIIAAAIYVGMALLCYAFAIIWVVGRQAKICVMLSLILTEVISCSPVYHSNCNDSNTRCSPQRWQQSNDMVGLLSFKVRVKAHPTLTVNQDPAFTSSALLAMAIARPGRPQCGRCRQAAG